MSSDRPAPRTSATGARAKALPPLERRAAIIDAVTPLVIEHGEHVTTRQVADAAGVAEGTIFRVFGDKDDLIVAAVEAALDATPFEQAIRSIPSDLPFEQRLVAVAEVIHRRVDDVWRLVSGLRPELRARVSRPLTTSPAILELFETERHRLRVEPVAAARMLRALVLSMTHPVLAGDPADVADIVDVVLHGIANDTAGDGTGGQVS